MHDHDEPARREAPADPETHGEMDSSAADEETHATTGGAAAAGAVTGGAIGLAGGPVGAALGAVGGAIVGAAAERVMHSDDDAARARDTDRDQTRPGQGPTGAERTLELREEELEARRRPVQTGEVSVGKEVVSERRALEVPVTRDEVSIERHPVDRRPAGRPIEAEGGQTLEVPVREEQVRVEKRPVVYEEVDAGTRAREETERVSGTVKREEARIEREGDARLADQGRAGS